jgi:hypothetical protein
MSLTSLPPGNKPPIWGHPITFCIDRPDGGAADGYHLAQFCLARRQEYDLIFQRL